MSYWKPSTPSLKHPRSTLNISHRTLCIIEDLQWPSLYPSELLYSSIRRQPAAPSFGPLGALVRIGDGSAVALLIHSSNWASNNISGMGKVRDLLLLMIVRLSHREHGMACIQWFRRRQRELRRRQPPTTSAAAHLAIDVWPLLICSQLCFRAATSSKPCIWRCSYICYVFLLNKMFF
jgi:hypothetical protein